MIPAEELRALLALKKAPLIGDIMAKRLIREYGSAQDIFKQRPVDIASINGIGKKKAAFVTDDSLFEKADKELTFIHKNDITCRVFTEDDYPKRLKHCVDGPIVYFEKGTIDWDNPYVLSIVGTRQITTNG